MLKVLPARKFFKLTEKDLKYLFTKELTKVEKAFFPPIDLIVFKRTQLIQPPAYGFTQRHEFEYSQPEVVDEVSKVLVSVVWKQAVGIESVGMGRKPTRHAPS